ncbi:hypothetical protein Fmac_018417 [Flemingia macrophylla]|uniref:Uncharacterized protein n=1 Tax=Flemingia macrophylla TaxID=520843 RepID=A0ABD1M4Y7_9FABA
MEMKKAACVFLLAMTLLSTVMAHGNHHMAESSTAAPALAHKGDVVSEASGTRSGREYF